MSYRTSLLITLVGIVWSCVLGLQRPPPRYSQQYMPDTAFSCRNKIVGSYYADPETDCQLFHVCVSVAGSIQDYKFLCPNDTAFDQESQTCADWYDVDCEAATLYYASDNFDLYRLGSGMESLHYDSVRTDAEPQDHLQRSETSDPVRSAANSVNRVTPTNYNSNSNSNSNSRDILRGSSSINFYSSKNGGKDEDYDNEKVYKEEPIQEPRKKSGVRKIARKQQYNSNNNNNGNVGNNYAASSTVAPIVSSSQSGTNYNGNYYNNNFNNQRTSAFPSSTTVRSVSQDTYNVRNQNNHKFNNPTSTYRPSTAQQTYSTYQAQSTTAKTTVYNNYNNAYNQNNNNNNQQQTSNSYGQSIGTSPKPTSYSQNYPNVAVTTARPTSYSQNYPDQQSYNTQFSQFGQNSRTQSTTVQPSTNYQPTDYTNFQRNYNNIQRSTSAPNTFPSTTAATTFYDNYNTNNGQYNKVNGQTSNRQSSSQTTKYYPNFTGSIYVPTTYSPGTKKSIINDNTQIPSNSRGGDRFNAQATGNDNGQYADKNNLPQSAKSTQYYDSTRAPKKATQYNSNYDITNNGKYFESSTGTYDFVRSQGGIGFSPSSINHLAETPRSTTPVPKRTGAPTTYNPNSFNANNQRQNPTTPKGTTYVSGSAKPFSTTTRFSDSPTPRTKATKKNDYDYAYYDNAGGQEYDGLELEHVAGNKESSKISRN